jgi:hypothetical protein
VHEIPTHVLRCATLSQPHLSCQAFRLSPGPGTLVSVALPVQIHRAQSVRLRRSPSGVVVTGIASFVCCSAEECLPKLQGLSARVNAPVQLCNHLTVDCCPVELTLDFTSQNLLHSPILVGVAKELGGEDDVLITICKVPSHDRRILTTADDPPCVELQFEHT